MKLDPNKKVRLLSLTSILVINKTKIVWTPFFGTDFSDTSSSPYRPLLHILQMKDKRVVILERKIIKRV